MDAFNHLSVLISVVLGLAITQLLQGFGRLIEQRREVRPFWPAVTIAVTLLAICIQTWWAMFGLRSHTQWTFGQFAIVLLQTIVLSLACIVAVPERSGEDMRATYFAHSRWLFSLLVAAAVISVVKDVVLDRHLPQAANLWFHAVFIALGAAAAATRSVRFHAANAVVLLALFAGYIALLFGRLP